MNNSEFEKKIDSYKALVRLERILKHRSRIFLKKVLLTLLVFSFAISSGLFFDAPASATSIFFLLLILWSIIIVCDAFFYSFYFSELAGDYGPQLALIFFWGNGDDALRDFALSAYGYRILNRMGIDSETFGDFLSSRKMRIGKDALVIELGDNGLESYFNAFYSLDGEFKNFLVTHGINAEIFSSTAKLVFDLEKKKLNSERWWSKEYLSTIKRIGRDWAFGSAYALSRWSFPLRFSLDENRELHPKEVDALETLLSKSNSANVILVGDEGSGKMEILEGLGRKIARQRTLSSLKNKKILILDLAGFSASAREKIAFERLLIELLNDAISAGNIILVIPDIAGLILEAESLEVDLGAILGPFLSSSGVQVVAISDQEPFHSVVDRHREILNDFEMLQVKSEGFVAIFPVLLDKILELESREGVIFTYPAILEAVQSAERYFVDSPLFDISRDLLFDSSAKVRASGRVHVLKEDVLDLVKLKTGVPTGEIASEERARLQNLESLLHERIVGQDEAVSSISDALRRARSGVNNPKRPMGSFLFLGPTGVGKTETTKALAEIFFGQSAKVLRLDMSEYNSPDSLNRLIGAYAVSESGVLSSMVRDNPYGVLLLDEFEKTDKRVLDLFLQILDEGMFSDALGRKISARNLIIIATSNAGSQLIFEAMQRGEKLLDKKEEILNEIIRSGIFKPELINRFDGVVLFHPLDETHLRGVAKKMLKLLEWRLKDKGITLVETDALINFLVKRGSDPKFGARSLNRAIQDTVEKIVADKIIAGELRPGSSLELSEGDLK